MSEIAVTPKPPYYAAIFMTIAAEGVEEPLGAMSERMDQLVAEQPGFLGMEYGGNLTICYWESREAITAWKANIEHLDAQRMGREKWFAQYHIRICKVEAEYGSVVSTGE
jgi:heme-degrading monooxygenase HmoA